MKISVHTSEMQKFTVIAYVLPDGGHYVETVEAADATAAAISIRTKLELKLSEFELVGVIVGDAKFAPVDHTQLALAPYSVASP